MVVKNTAGSIVVQALNADGAAVTGDAANITCKIAKDHATPAAIASPNVTETEGGMYTIDYLAADVNYDHVMFYPTSSTGTTTAVLVVDNSNGRTDSWSATLNGLSIPTADTIANTVLTESVLDHSGTPNSLAEYLSDIKDDTNELQTDDIPGTLSGLSTLTAQQAADAVWDESLLTHAGPDFVAASVLFKILDVHNWSNSIYSKLPSQGNAMVSLSEITSVVNGLNDISVSDIWNEPISAYVTSQTFGNDLKALNPWMDEVYSWTQNANDISAADVWREDLTAHMVVGGLGAGYVMISNMSSLSGITTAVNGLNDIDAAEVADAVWDELLSGHQISGSGGDRVANIYANTISTQSIVDKLPSGGRNMAGAGDTATNLDQVTGIDAAGVRTAIGMAAADLDTQLASLSTFDPTTDEVDADVKKTNGVVIVGAGVEGDEFRGENA